MIRRDNVVVEAVRGGVCRSDRDEMHGLATEQ